MPRRIVVALAASLAAATLAAATATASAPVQDPGVPPLPAAAGPGVKVVTPAGRRVWPRVTASLRIARAFWEARPRGCRTIAVYEAALLDEFGGVTVAQVPCAMWIGSGYFAGHSADDRVATCDEIVRQYGFLVGARRSLHPRSIMHVGTTSTVWGCDHRFGLHLRSDAAPMVWATR